MIDFTDEELRHLNPIMQGYSDPDCEVCASARKKIADEIHGRTVPDTTTSADMHSKEQPK